MHGGHRHPHGAHDHHHDHDHHTHDDAPDARAIGHNKPSPGAAQWQTPHRPQQEQQPEPEETADLDLVESTFIETFPKASDPTSFLRLAGVPFRGIDAEGQTLNLLRVEIEDVTDIGSVMPLLGGTGMRYDPLPAKLASHRRRLTFAYHDGRQVIRLDFRAARALTAAGENDGAPSNV